MTHIMALILLLSLTSCEYLLRPPAVAIEEKIAEEVIEEVIEMLDDDEEKDGAD